MRKVKKPRRPRAKKVAASLKLAKLSQTERRDVVSWLRDILGKISKKKTSSGVFSASLKYH